MRKALVALLTLACALVAPAQTATGLPGTRRPEPIVTPPWERGMSLRSGQVARPRKRAPKNPYAPSPYRAPKAPKDPFSAPYPKAPKPPKPPKALGGRDPLASDPSFRPPKPPKLDSPYGAPPAGRRRKTREESYGFEPKPQRPKSPYTSVSSGRLKLPPKPRTSKPPKLTAFPDLMPEQPRQPKFAGYPKAPKAPKAPKGPKAPGSRKSRKSQEFLP